MVIENDRQNRHNIQGVGRLVNSDTPSFHWWHPHLPARRQSPLSQPWTQTRVASFPPPGAGACLYLCMYCVFVYLCICVFVYKYLCICVCVFVN